MAVLSEETVVAREQIIYIGFEPYVYNLNSLNCRRARANIGVNAPTLLKAAIHMYK